MELEGGASLGRMGSKPDQTNDLVIFNFFNACDRLPAARSGVRDAKKRIIRTSRVVVIVVVGQNDTKCTHGVKLTLHSMYIILSTSYSF